MQHGAGGAGGVTAALDFQRVKVRLIGDVVTGEGLGTQRVTGFEINDLVGARAHRLGVGRVLARLGAHEAFKHMLGQNDAHAAHQGLGPKRRWAGKVDTHRVRINFDDLDVAIGGHGDHGRCGVAGISGGEDHVVSGEGLAVVPVDAAFQFPDHTLAVGGEATIGACGDLSSQARDEVAFTVPAGQGLVKHATGVLVFGATGVVRVQVHGSLPIDHLQGAATAAFGGFVGDGRHRLRQAFVHQQHGCHRRCEAQAHHPLDKAAPGQSAFADVFDQGTNFTFLHGKTPRGFKGIKKATVGDSVGRAGWMLAVAIELPIRVSPGFEGGRGKASIG